MRSGEITFKLSNDVFNDAVELVARKTSLMGAVNHPIAGDIEARMLDDVAKQLGKTLLTKSQKDPFYRALRRPDGRGKSEPGSLHILRQSVGYAFPSRPFESKGDARESV